MRQHFFANRPLAFSLLLSIAIAATEVPLWIAVFVFALLLWRFLYEKFDIYKLSPKITPLLGVIVFILVYMQYRTILGQEESTIVLLGLAALSILNYKTERDGSFLILLGFLLVVIKSVFSLDFIWTVPAVISFFGLWVAMLRSSKVNKYKYLSSMALRSVPVFLVLFIFFPRLVIFQTKQVQKNLVQSGFSEDLNPWRVSEMNLQNQMVFRADFKNNFMNSDELYWRGAVLHISNGFSWQKGSIEKISIPVEDDIKAPVAYTIILEPLNLKNVFVLESPVSIRATSSPIVPYQHRTFSLNEVQTQQVQFQALSSLDRRTVDEDDPTHLKKYLNFMGELPPKTKALVEEIKGKKLSVRGQLEFLRKFFAEKGFIYTLKPGVYKNDLDEFLFDRRKGFCEHYAAALGTLARALGIPARVVLGYQGGMYNSFGNFWKVSQRDAHAWVEIAMDGRWVRFDPTGWVSPLRLSLGGEAFFSLTEDEQILYSKDKAWRKTGEFRNYFDEIKLVFDNLNYYWTLLLLNYDLQTQLDYLKRLKANSLLLGVIGFLLIGVFLYRRNRLRPEVTYRHGMHELLTKIELWAGQHGMKIDAGQTPLQFLQNLQQNFPTLQAILQQIAQEYVRAAYQNQSTHSPVPELEKNWREASRQVKQLNLQTET